MSHETPSAKTARIYALHTPVRDPDEAPDQPDIKQPPVPPDQEPDIVPVKEPPKRSGDTPMIA